MPNARLHRAVRLLLAPCLLLALAGLPAAPRTEAAPPNSPAAVYQVDRDDDVIASACTAAANDCSLRGAIIAANSNPGSTIEVQVGHTYSLTNTAQGDLQALANMTIYPTGPCGGLGCFTIVQGGPGWNDRLMHVTISASVVISGLVWMNGNANNGGAFLNEGQLDLRVSLVFSNTSAGWGGGILNEGGVLTLTDSFVNQNKAASTGGGIANQGGTVTIVNTSVTSNTVYGVSPGQGRGGGLVNLNSFDQLTPGLMFISNSQVLSNTTPLTVGLGGGIMSGGHLSILNTTLRGNQAHDGGAVLVSAGYLTMTATTVMSNTAADGGGGGLYNDGVALLTNGTWRGNTAGSGGGILNNLGDMQVWNSAVLSNTTTNGGGGVRSGGPLFMTAVTVQGNHDSSGSGGGIVTSSNLTLADSVIHNNTGFQGGGVATSSLAAQVLLDNTQVTSNTATYGGGLAGFGTFTLTHGSLVNNNAAFQGGGANIFSTGRLVAQGGEFNGNTISGGGPGSAGGGGILNAGQVVLEGVALRNNQTANGSGGGLNNAAGATASLSQVVVVSNTASHDGGGLANAGALTVTASAIVSNTAVQTGGGITTTGSLYLLNSTLSANVADDGGGGIWNGGTATVRFSTFVGNQGNSNGGGINNAGTFTLRSSLLALNTAANGDDCYGSYGAASTHNLVRDSDDCPLSLVDNLMNVTPLLSSLTQIGGTYVHEYLYQSPGLDAADPNDCPATDQAGNSRPIGAGCDIGAFESLALAPYRLFLPLIRR